MSILASDDGLMTEFDSGCSLCSVGSKLQLKKFPMRCSVAFMMVCTAKTCFKYDVAGSLEVLAALISATQFHTTETWRPGQTWLDALTLEIVRCSGQTRPCATCNAVVGAVGIHLIICDRIVWIDTYMVVVGHVLGLVNNVVTRYTVATTDNGKNSRKPLSYWKSVWKIVNNSSFTGAQLARLVYRQSPLPFCGLVFRSLLTDIITTYLRAFTALKCQISLK